VTRTASRGARPLDDERLGRRVETLDTPALLLDLDAFEANAKRLADVIRASGASWRPHVKAHKSTILAHRQLGLGAVGVTCAKVSEAEVMVEGGMPSVLIANEVPTRAKLERVAAMQDRAEVLVCVDDPAIVDLTSEVGVARGRDIPVLVEVDVGERRAGVLPGGAAIELAARVHEAPGVRFAGLMGYEGHLLTLWPEGARDAACRRDLAALVDLRHQLERRGIPVSIVSSGGSGTYRTTPTIAGITEIQAGGACLMDRFYAEECHLAEFAFALTVITTVTSRPTPDRVITDAGWKALSKGAGGMPHVVDRAEIEFTDLHAEHGLARIPDGAAALVVGATLLLVPGYSDATIHLYDWIHGHRNGRVEEMIPVEARGCVQ
jgi:D-serine deaminase-like pyridoxal phosphate-dependent protein